MKFETLYMKNIFESDFKDNEILSFNRKDNAWGKEDQRIAKTLIKEYLGNPQFKTISEYKRVGDYTINHYEILLSEITTEDYKIIDRAIDFHEIISRDRYLRELPLLEAKELVLKLCKYYIDLFKKNSFKLIVSPNVDCYILDLLVHIGKEFNILVLGYVRWLFSGYIRITIYGEHHIIRQPNLEEIDEHYRFLKANKKYVFLKNNNFAYLLGAVKAYALYKYRLVYKYLWSYKLMGRKEYDFLVLKAAYPETIKYFFCKKFFQPLPLTIDRKTTIYIPLNFYPEASVDYYNDFDKYPYYHDVLKVLQYYSSKGFTVLLKEHPSMVYRRPLNLYKTWTKIKNVYLIDPFISTKEIFKVVDMVFIWCSTVGLEALLEDKQLITKNNNNYWDFEREKVFPTLKTINKYQGVENKKALITEMLKNTLPLKY